jgi:hypothetical protein
MLPFLPSRRRRSKGELVLVYVGYGLGGPEFESRLGQDGFVSRTSRQKSLDPTQPTVQCVPGFFSRCKMAGE